ncbi:type IV secretion system DNA-binding domain-containing protein [Fluviispira sanaruensis]|uniref:Type IV secretion system coupling protein TraD DNA-binding domain-containing protein n=1 Tax=Fluviispira sanaruensis TaxID=2493639 RepID=A0A4P2VMT1_FLUSA|nr:type IV secretion system DNA-binding domain-containing protein [Fluviispira sanaruensis]BBH54723.1 hypothetical protein JCM31447_31970 [Fluviispira sanaruensis]
MKSSNYGLDICYSYGAKILKEMKVYIILSFLGALLFTLLTIQLKFQGGISWYFDLAYKKFTYYIKSEVFSIFANDSDKISHLIIDKFWKAHSSDTNLFIFTFIFGFMASLGLAIYFTKKIGIKFKDGVSERKDELHYVEPDELIKEIKRDVKDLANNIEYTKNDLVISKSKIRIPDKIASLHFGMCGAPATGKTNAMDEQLVQERKFKNKVLILDPRGEFFAKHGKEGDHILSLYDRRARKWNFWCENLPPKFLANALIEMKEGGASNKFFDKTGREVMAAALRIAKSQEELWQIVNYSEEDLYNLLLDNKELSKQYLGKKASGQSAGVIASAFMNLNFIKYLNHHVMEMERLTGDIEEEFSLTKWVANDDDTSWIFIIDENRNLEDAKPLHRLWFDIVTSSSFDRDTSKKNLRQISLYCDEISTVGNLPTLPLVFDKGRRFKTKMVIGFQSFPQLEIIYGREIAQSIYQGLQNIIVFACNSRKEAEIYTDRMGRSEVVELDTSMSVGGRHSTNLSQRTRQVDSVTPSQIQALKDNQAFLKLARFNPTKVEFEYVGLETVNKGSLSEVAESSWLDTFELIPYESKEMIANKEKELLEKSANPENSAQKEMLQEFSKSLKYLVDSAVKVYLNKPIDKESLNLIAVEIMEKYGSSKSTKLKINEIFYGLFINDKTKLIHVICDSLEFTINFPTIDVQKFSAKSKNDFPKSKSDQDEVSSRKGDTSSSSGVGIKIPNTFNIDKSEETNINKEETKEPEVKFKSIPIHFRSPLQDKSDSNSKEKISENEMSIQ